MLIVGFLVSLFSWLVSIVFARLVAIVVALVAALVVIHVAALVAALVGSIVFFVVGDGRVLGHTLVLDDWKVTGVVVHRVRHLLMATVGKINRVIAVNDAIIVRPTKAATITNLIMVIEVEVSDGSTGDGGRT